MNSISGDFQNYSACIDFFGQAYEFSVSNLPVSNFLSSAKNLIFNQFRPNFSFYLAVSGGHRDVVEVLAKVILLIKDQKSIIYCFLNLTVQSADSWWEKSEYRACSRPG